MIPSLEYPEDFPLGKYFYIIEDTSEIAAGTFPPLKIELNVLQQGGF